MPLRTKVVLLLLSAFSLYFVAHYAVKRFVLVPSFVELERKEAEKDLARCRQAIHREIEHVGLFVRDWAVWDEPYQYVQDRNSHFEEANLVDTTFSEANLHLFYFFDIDGEIVWGRTMDHAFEEYLQLSAFEPSAIGSDHVLLSHDDTTDLVQGVLLTEYGPMLVASHPIITSNGEGPIRGTLVMGRFLSDELVSELNDQTRVAFHAWTTDDPELPNDVRETASKLADADLVIQEVDEKTLDGACGVTDIFGQPALVLQATLPRQITLEASGVLRFASTSLAVLSLLVVGLLFVALQRFVVCRIRTLAALSRSVSAGKSGGQVVASNSRDEIRQLEQEFESMLERLARDEREREVAKQQAREHHDQLAHVGRLSTMGEMATGIAHELNQPLSAITNYASAIDLCLSNQDSIPHDEIAELGSRISRQAQRAGAIIRRLRMLVQKSQPSKDDVDINEAVAEIIAFLSNEARLNEIELRADLSDGISEVVADRIQIQQVILKLVRNAFDSTSLLDQEPRHVSIRTLLDGAGQFVEIIVTDNGVGLPYDDCERIFDAFETTKRTGLGMGLAISRSIVTAHGGKLWAEPRTDRGASFHVVLPITTEQKTSSESIADRAHIG
jgi:signal transduction histidine kinase